MTTWPLKDTDDHPGLMFEEAGRPIRHHVHSILRSPNGGGHGMEFDCAHREARP